MVPKMFLLVLLASQLTEIFALCGRRGSPPYNVAKNIFELGTNQEVDILHCFIIRMVKIEDNPENQSLQPTLFLNCVLEKLGVTVDERRNHDIILDKAQSYSQDLRASDMRYCLNQHISCPEGHILMDCNRAIEELYHNNKIKETVAAIGENKVD